MKYVIISLCFLFNIAQAEEAKTEPTEVKKEEKTKKPSMGLREQKKKDRIPPWEYNGLILNLQAGLGFGDKGQKYVNNTTNGNGDAGSTTVELVGDAQGGWMYKGLFLVGDFRLDYGQHERIGYKLNSNLSDESDTAFTMSYGVTAGYELNFGLRLYAGYSPLEILTIGKSGGGDPVSWVGKSTKFGLSYLLASGIGIGVENIRSKYDEREEVKLPATVNVDGDSVYLEKIEHNKVVFFITIPIQKPRK